MKRKCILWLGCGLWTWRCKSRVGSCRSDSCSVTPSSTFYTADQTTRAKSYTMIVDALTYSSSPFLFMGMGPALIIFAGKNIVPERQRVYQVGFDYSLGSSPARHIYQSVECRTLTSPSTTALPARVFISVPTPFFFCSNGDVLTCVC